VGVRDVLAGPLDQLVARVADDGAELLVHAQEAAVEILVADADGRVLERAAEPLLALPQRRLGLPEVGDVGAGPEPCDDPACAVADWGAAGLEPAVHAVRTADAIFHVIGAAPGHRVGPESPGRRPGRP